MNFHPTDHPDTGCPEPPTTHTVRPSDSALRQMRTLNAIVDHYADAAGRADETQTTKE